MPILPPDVAAEKLDGYPPEILEAYQAFHTQRDPADLDRVVFGLIGFLMPEPAEQPLEKMEDSTRLREDLQIDSITIAEAVFLIEELFDISIRNEDLMKIETIGNLRGHLRDTVTQ
ncbi:MAG: acyl carrier protein [Opitutales bacterium]|nr:acyl carrier protein [Opitutales bacterium]